MDLGSGQAHLREPPPKPDHQERFQWGLVAYIINIRGIEKIMDAHFSDRSPTGFIRTLGGEIAETYFDVLEGNNYVTLSSFFIIQGVESVIAGRHEQRLNRHLCSNNIHIHTQETDPEPRYKIHRQIRPHVVLSMNTLLIICSSRFSTPDLPY